MKNLLLLSRSDFRATFRDPVFRGLLFFPLLAFAMIRWGLPVAIAAYPAIAVYNPVILMWGCLQSGIMFGFVYGFLFLEEKEEQLWQVIRVLPVSGLKLVASRLLLGMFVSALVNFGLLHFGNVLQVPLVQELLLAALYGLVAPLIALYLGAFANNRIEGLAQMKIVNLLLVLPGLIYFIPARAVHLTAFIPTYWSFRSLEEWQNPGRFLLFYSISLAFQVSLIVVLNRRLERSIAS